MTATKVSPTTDPTNADTLTVEVTFSEPLSQANRFGFKLIGSTIDVQATSSTIDGSDPTKVTVVFSDPALANANETVALQLFQKGHIKDLARNNLDTTNNPSMSFLTFTLDNQGPTFVSATKITPTDAVTNADTFTIEVMFSEDLSQANKFGFKLVGNSIDVQATSTTIKADKSKVTVVFSDPALANADETVALQLFQRGHIKDLARNDLDISNNPDPSVLTYVIDNTPPGLTITAPAEATNTFTVTFDFQEDVTGFIEGDITVTGGVLVGGSLSGGPRIFTAQVTPTKTGNVVSVVTIAVAAGAAADAAGNDNTAAEATVNFTDVAAKTERVIQNFLSERAQNIVNGEPELGDLLDGDGSNGGDGAIGSLTGEATGVSAFRFDFSSSLKRVAAAARKNDDGVSTLDISAGPERFNVWIRGSVVRFEQDDSGYALTGLAYVGADYRVMSNVLIGLLVQGDWTSSEDNANNASAHGFGWMVGPYAVVRPLDYLTIEGRVAAGMSHNSVSPFDTYSDDVDGVRFLGKLRATGSFAMGRVTVRPSVGLIYFHEETESYTDSLGFEIDEVSTSLGRVDFGPTISYALPTEEHGFSSSVFVSATGVYDFDVAETVDIATGAETGSTDGLRARLGGGLELTSTGGYSLKAEGFYDGVGADDFEGYGGSLKLKIPFN